MNDPIFFSRSFKGLCYGNELWSQIEDSAFIWHTGVPKRISGSQFRFKKIKCRYSSYIFVEIWQASVQ